MMRSNLTSKLKCPSLRLIASTLGVSSDLSLHFPFRTLEKMGLRKKVGIAEYQDYSSSSEEEDLLLSKP